MSAFAELAEALRNQPCQKCGEKNMPLRVWIRDREWAWLCDDCVRPSL